MKYLNLSQNSQHNITSQSHKASGSSFFKNNLPWVRLAPPRDGEPNMVIRILPGMDFSYQDNTEALLSSTEPFKTPSGQYTSWAQFVKGYMYFGKLRTHLLSPDTLDVSSHKYPRKGVDAINDLRRFIYFNSGKYATSNPYTGAPTITQEEAKLIEFQQNFQASLESCTLPSKPRTLVLSNILHKNNTSGEMEQKIGVYSEQMFQTLIQIVKHQIPVNSGLAPVSENYPDLLFGDVTDQNTGCLLEVRYCRNSLTNSNILTLTPSKDPNNETRLGHTIYPVSDDILRKRYILCDPDNVLDIWSYQRQLDLLCKDPLVPVTLLKKAADSGAFPEGVLNLDLREEGEEILAARESFKKSISEGIKTPTPGVAGHKFPSTPQRVEMPIAQNTPTTPTFTKDTATSNLPPLNREVVAASIKSEQIPESDFIVEDYVPAPEIPVKLLDSKESDRKDEAVILEKAKASLSPEEYEKFKTLHMTMISNPQSLTPSSMMEYFQLNTKIQ